MGAHLSCFGVEVRWAKGLPSGARSWGIARGGWVVAKLAN